MKKKIIIVTTLLLCLSFFSCGNSNQKSDSSQLDNETYGFGGYDHHKDEYSENDDGSYVPIDPNTTTTAETEPITTTTEQTTTTTTKKPKMKFKKGELVDVWGSIDTIDVDNRKILINADALWTIDCSNVEDIYGLKMYAETYEDSIKYTGEVIGDFKLKFTKIDTSDRTYTVEDFKFDEYKDKYPSSDYDYNYKDSSTTDYDYNNDVKAVTDEDEKAEAITIAKDIVKENLKVPSSADFSWDFDDYFVCCSGKEYTVSFYFEAENSFGAQLRQMACVKYTSRGSYKYTYKKSDVYIG